MATRNQPCVERDALPAFKGQSALADKHSSARPFSSGHLATDCRSYRRDERVADSDNLPGLDRRTKTKTRSLDMSKCDLHIHSRYSARSEEWLFRRFDFPDSYSAPKELHRQLLRSEERRVGKECRSRWG